MSQLVCRSNNLGWLVVKNLESLWFKKNNLGGGTTLEVSAGEVMEGKGWFYGKPGLKGLFICLTFPQIDWQAFNMPHVSLPTCDGEGLWAALTIATQEPWIWKKKHHLMNSTYFFFPNIGETWASKDVDLEWPWKGRGPVVGSATRGSVIRIRAT